MASAGAGQRQSEPDELTKWRWSVNGVNKIGSRISGSGIAKARARVFGGKTTPLTASGAGSHFDRYFTQAQNESLSLRVAGLTGETELEADADSDADQLLVLRVQVKSSSHPKTCARGETGTLAIHDRADAPDLARLRLCGGEHDHRYIHSAKYPVKIVIREVIDPADVRAVLTVNGNTAQHKAIGYSPIITFKHGTQLRIDASAAKRLPKGWRLVVFSERDPLNGTPPLVYDQYHVLCEPKGGERECPLLSGPSTLPLNAGGCHRIAAEISAPNPPRRVSTAAVCMTPVP